jgi:hypothetical protein
VRAFWIVALLACHSALPVPQLGAQGACPGPDDRAYSLIAELANWRGATDPERIADRDTLYNIPVVDPDESALVTADAVCERARHAYAAPRSTCSHLVHATLRDSTRPSSRAVSKP